MKGIVAVDGKDVRATDAVTLRRTIGLRDPTGRPPPHMTIADNVAMCRAC